MVSHHEGVSIFIVHSQRDWYMNGNTMGLAYTCKGMSKDHNINGKEYQKDSFFQF